MKELGFTEFVEVGLGGDLTAKYEAEGYNHRWNVAWDYAARRNSDSWEAVMRIPLDKLGLRITVNNRCRILPVRHRADGQNAETSSHAGAGPHMPAAFPEMLLKE